MERRGPELMGPPSNEIEGGKTNPEFTVGKPEWVQKPVSDEHQAAETPENKPSPDAQVEINPFKNSVELPKITITPDEIDKWIESGRGHTLSLQLDKFIGPDGQDLDHRDIAFKLIENGLGRYVVLDLENF